MSSNDGDSTSNSSKKNRLAQLKAFIDRSKKKKPTDTGSEAQSSKPESATKDEPMNADESATFSGKPVDPYASGDEEVAENQVKTRKRETEEAIEQIIQQTTEEKSDKTPSAPEKAIDSHESNDEEVIQEAPKAQQPEEVTEVIEQVSYETPAPPEIIVDPYASAREEVLKAQTNAEEKKAKETIEEVIEQPLHESPSSSKQVVDSYVSTGKELPEIQPKAQQQKGEEVSAKQLTEEHKTQAYYFWIIESFIFSVEPYTNENPPPRQPNIPKVIPRQNSFQSDFNAENKPVTSRPPLPYHRQYDEWKASREDPWTARASGIRFKNSENNESNHSKSGASGVSWNGRTRRLDIEIGGWSGEDNGGWGDVNASANEYTQPVLHAKADENSNLSHHSNAGSQSSNDVRSSYYGGQHSNFDFHHNDNHRSEKRFDNQNSKQPNGFHSASNYRGQDRVCYNCHQSGHLSRYCPEKEVGEHSDQRNEQQHNTWDTRRDNCRGNQNDYRGTQHNNYHDNQHDYHGNNRREFNCNNQKDSYHNDHHNNQRDSQRYGYQSNQRDHYQSSQRGNYQNKQYGNQPNSFIDGCNQTFVPQQSLRDQRDEFCGHRESNGSRGGNNVQNQSFSNRPPCIPVQRTVDQIFQDDQENDIDERTLYDSDGGVIVVDGPDDMPVIDAWDEANLLPKVLENIKRAKYVRPRNIQRYALPLIWQGYDLKAQAETGSGKSAGFLVPIIDKLAREFEGKDPNERHHLVSALVVVPTRELAIQLSEQARKLADGTGVRVNSAYGEYKFQNNVENIHLNGCDILVATLGRLLNFMRNKIIFYDKLKYFVLDEVDVLLSYDSMEEIREICAFEGFPGVSDRQTLCFSATMSPAVRQLADQFCKPKSPIIRNKLKDLNQRVTVEIVEVPFAERNQYLMKYLRGEADKNNGVLPKKLIFVEKKRDVDELAAQLQELNIPIRAIHGERSQQEREEITRAFREGKIRALVATELFARGLDIADLGHVINVHMPSTREKFVHRIGRTGRTHSGVATAYFDPNFPDDREMAGTIIEVLTKLKLDVPQFVINAKEPNF